MTNEASAIGANFSNYQGSAGLGGGSLGVVNIDTKPIEDLARYTMLYNKAEYDQRQKDAEKAAAEIADYMNYDLTTSIPKDAKLLQDKYQKVIDYISKNPDAINYKNREKWSEYKRLRNDLDNDLKSAKVRSVMNMSREKEIADETDEKIKEFRKTKLEEEINSTDIRTPLKYSQQYDISIPDFGTNSGIKVDVTKTGSNQIFQRDLTLFDINEANRAGAAAELGFSSIDPTTETGKLKSIKADQNFWVKGAGILNQAIKSALDSKLTVGEENKIPDLPIVKNIEAFNKYVEQKRAEIAAGIYVDKLGNKITFGVGPFREEDYTPINWKDGVSPSELAVVAQFSKWAGDEYKTKITQSNDAIEEARIAAIRRGQDLDAGVAWFNAKTARMNAEKSPASKDSSGIQAPAILFGQHIERVKEYIDKNKKDLIVSFDATDNDTKKALGIEDGSKGFVLYGKDGSIRVGTDAKGNGGTPVTLDQLKQGYVNVVKAGLSKDGVQAEGFIESAEKEFNNIWGTKSGKTIWDTWGNKKSVAPKDLTPEQKAFNLKYFGNENGK